MKSHDLSSSCCDQHTVEPLTSRRQSSVSLEKEVEIKDLYTKPPQSKKLAKDVQIKQLVLN